MKASGYVGAEDEIMRHWLLRNKRRVDAVNSRPDLLTPLFYAASLKYSQKERPQDSFVTVKKDIGNNMFYRRPAPFSVIIYPDGDSLVRSGLPITSVFPSLPTKDGMVSKEDAARIATDQYDAYFEHEPHASEVDYMLELLFSPFITSADKFGAYAAETLLQTSEAPNNSFQWFWERTAFSLAAATAKLAFRRWASEPCGSDGIKRLTPVYCFLMDKLIKAMDGRTDASVFTDSEEVEKFADQESRDLFSFYTTIFPTNDKIFLSALLRQYSEFLVRLALPNNSNTELYMPTWHHNMPLLVGHNSTSEDAYLIWMLRIASAFPDTSIYALALDKWTPTQRNLLISSLSSDCNSPTLVWTSRNDLILPEELLKQYTTREAYIGDAFCFSSPDCGNEHFAESLPEQFRGRTAGLNVSNRRGTYEIGIIEQKVMDAIKRKDTDDLSDMPINLAKEAMAVSSPFIQLPNDEIEEARFKVLTTLGYRASDINRKSTYSAKAADFYCSAADIQESRIHLPKLNIDEIMRRDMLRRKHNKDTEEL